MRTGEERHSSTHRSEVALRLEGGEAVERVPIVEDIVEYNRQDDHEDRHDELEDGLDDEHPHRRRLYAAGRCGLVCWLGRRLDGVSGGMSETERAFLASAAAAIRWQPGPEARGTRCCATLPTRWHSLIVGRGGRLGVAARCRRRHERRRLGRLLQRPGSHPSAGLIGTAFRIASIFLAGTYFEPGACSHSTCAIEFFSFIAYSGRSEGSFHACSINQPCAALARSDGAPQGRATHYAVDVRGGRV